MPYIKKPGVFKVGLTGGIGSGKSTVTRLFADMGVPTFSADVISHELCEPGQAAYRKIIATFGRAILNENGTLDRGALGDLVFNDSRQRIRLEHILHPLIMQTMHQRADIIDYPYCVLDIPLLINTAERECVNRVLVVHCAINIRVQRIKKRNGWPQQKIDRVMESQPNDEAFAAAADDYVNNNAEIMDMVQTISALHEQYLLLASDFHSGLS